MAFELPRLPPGEIPPDRLQIYWQQLVEATETALNSLSDAIAAIAAAQAAADAANTAAANANATADAITTSSELGESYVSGITLTATDAGTDATINISAHTRHYPQPDGSSVDVAVSAGSVTGLAYDTIYFIYYDDPTRAGGAVTYQATTTETTAAQIGDRHTVGATRTPLAGAADTSGATTRPPGTRAVEISTL